VRRLRRLDRDVAACIEEIPAARRKLVTTHDALGYYARRYGLEVVGTVIPSLSTRGQPSAGETADLVRTIREQDVRAIFAESSVNAKVEEAIARETGARVGEPLWADTLGPPGSSGETYLGALRANAGALVDGFTGGRATCSLPR
jgi:ABC-type Zn uptake system ZnuABC Zn-binding protein ZnuA